MNQNNIMSSPSLIVETVSGAYPAYSDSAASRDRYQASAARVTELIGELPDVFKTALTYHHARLTSLAGDSAQALQILDKLCADETPLPEAVWSKLQLRAGDESEAGTRQRIEVEDGLGTLLPISAWSMVRDARLEQAQAESLDIPLALGAPPPIIPTLDQVKFFQIAALFDDMRMLSETANAYREAVYGTLAPPNFPEFGFETWVSADAADAWLAIARAEVALSRDKWAVQAILMAVVSSSQTHTEAKSLLQQILDNVRDAPELEPSIEKLTEIAQIYRECNLHTRALEVLETAAALPGADVSALRTQITAEWTQVLNAYKRGREDICYLYGVKVSTAAPKTLSPPPFNYGD